ncbi:hypothetical protein KQX54_004350, partial [Cotesia glomerata]
HTNNNTISSININNINIMNQQQNLISLAFSESKLRRQFDLVNAYWGDNNLGRNCRYIDPLLTASQLVTIHLHQQLHNKRNNIIINNNNNNNNNKNNNNKNSKKNNQNVGLLYSKSKPLGTAQASKKVQQQLLRTN